MERDKKLAASVTINTTSTEKDDIEKTEMNPFSDDKCADRPPEVAVYAPTKVIQVRPHTRSRSLGRNQRGDMWSQYSRRSASGRRGRSMRVSAVVEDSAAARDAGKSRSSSRPLTPLNDGPAPVLPRYAESDASSVTSAPELASCTSLPQPTAPELDSRDSAMRRYHPNDTLIGRIPEQPETRESLVTQLLGVGLFVIQPVYLSHRFQEYNGEKLMVLDQWGNPLLFAVETHRSAAVRSCCCCCTAHRRPHQMTLYNMEQRPVAHFSRRLGCVSCWSPCLLQRARLRDVIRTQEEASPDAPADRHAPESEIYYGRIRQRWHPARAEFVCSGIRGGVVLRVRGPRRGLCGAGGADAVFHILSMHGHARIGGVSPHWKALDVNVFHRSDNYGVEFDRQLPSRAKMSLLAAALLLDFLYFNVKCS